MPTIGLSQRWLASVIFERCRSVMDPFTGLSISQVPDFNSAFAEAHGPQRSPILGCHQLRLNSVDPALGGSFPWRSRWLRIGRASNL